MKPLGKLLYIFAIVIFAAVFLYCGFQLYQYYSESIESQSAYNDLASMMEHAMPSTPITPNVPDPTGDTQQATEPPSPYVTVIHPETGEETQLLPEFAELFLLNPDLVGWITIPETNINYPVVQSAIYKPDYYLRRDFYGKKDTHGCIYAREQCDVFAPSDNITIYGHKMKDQTMFAQLVKYESKEYWQENPYIQFNTLLERHTYEIISVFKISASVTSMEFQYHLFVDAAEPADIDSFIASCQEYALYDTGLTAQAGDKLITLSTCDYSMTNGRLVVVAKRID